MPASITTKPLRDGAGNLMARQVVDVSGTGAGPFLALLSFANAAGTGIVDMEGELGALLAKLNDGIGLLVGGADVSAANPLPIGNAQVATATATIPAGQSVSGPVDLGTGRLVGIILPSGWTEAEITFLASADGATYAPLYDDTMERSIPSGTIVPLRFLALPIADWLMVRALRLRSGSMAVPVNQSAERNIILVTAR